MDISEFLFFPIIFVWDKLIFLLKLKNQVNELRSAHLIQQYARNNVFPFKSIDAIWYPFLIDNEILLVDVKKIYNLKSTIYFDWTEKKFRYFIRYHLWNLLDFFEIDTWNWNNEDVFDRASLKTYALYLKNGRVILLLVVFQNQKFILLSKFDLKKLPILSFRNRQLVYNEYDKFISL